VLDSPDRTEYEWLTIVSIILTLLTSSRFVFETMGIAICRGFVAEALVRLGIIIEKPPSHMMSADLAKKDLTASQAAAYGNLAGRQCRLLHPPTTALKASASSQCSSAISTNWASSSSLSRSSSS